MDVQGIPFLEKLQYRTVSEHTFRQRRVQAILSMVNCEHAYAAALESLGTPRSFNYGGGHLKEEKVVKVAALEVEDDATKGLDLSVLAWREDSRAFATLVLGVASERFIIFRDLRTRFADAEVRGAVPAALPGCKEPIGHVHTLFLKFDKTKAGGCRVTIVSCVDTKAGMLHFKGAVPETMQFARTISSKLAKLIELVEDYKVAHADEVQAAANKLSANSAPIVFIAGPNGRVAGRDDTIDTVCH